jgi:hypothetical protein
MTPNPQSSDGSETVITPAAHPVEGMKVTIQPKKNCKKCHGLGRLGFIDGDQNNPLICQCVIKVYKEVQAQVKAKTKEIGVQSALIPPAEIVQGVVVTELPEKTDLCVSSANDQPKPPDTI